MDEQRIYSVSEFVDTVRVQLEQSVGLVVIQGEVTEYHVSRDRLVYFELKDAQSRILCFMMVWELHAEIHDGMEIRVLGVPALFKGSGKFHLRVQAVELIGQGELQRQLEMLKIKLTAEGMFEMGRKRPLPRFPTMIGLITSKDAAAYTDVLRVKNNRWPGIPVIFRASAVQGIGAAKDLVEAIRDVNGDGRADVIILTRGGGSLEDLQAFNDESVARAIFGSSIPIVCGVGHERDWTIADLVADRRAATPSNAAEIVVPSREEIWGRVSWNIRSLSQLVDSAIDQQRQGVTTILHRLESSIMQTVHQTNRLIQTFLSEWRVWYHGVETYRRQVPILAFRMQTQWALSLTTVRERLRGLERLIETISPSSTLRRGYSITRIGKTVLRNAKQAPLGTSLTTELSDGIIQSTVTSHDSKT